MSAHRPLRVVFCWAEVSGYAAACWQALVKRPGLEVHVIHPNRILDRPNPFDVAPLLRGVSNEMFDAKRDDLDRFLLEAVRRRDPDVVVLCGWIFRPYTRLATSPQLAGVRMILGMDSPWRATTIQRLARFRLARLVRRLDLVVTAGERSAEYARRLGIPDRRLRSGFYGFDYDSFARAAAASPRPRQFLFAGRYEKVKGVATLVDAYRRYRREVAEPWGLTCRGMGAERGLLTNEPGITEAGFAQPSELPRIFAAHGAFVLPSRFEPWGVVIAEAAAAALPVVCTSACGAAADIVRPYYNGIVVPPDDAGALCRAMRWIHDHADDLPEMGARGQALAAAFAAPAWAARWHNYMLDVTTDSRTTPCAG